MADYVIRSGDTLSGIAQRMGTTVQALAQANGISNPNLIRAGATLRIPDAQGGATPAPAPAPPASPPSVPPQSSPGSYTVRSGDTLSRIASQNGTSVEELTRLNGISNPNRIGVGQTIQLPPQRGGVPLPRPNVARPNVPGPPLERGAPMQVGRDIPGYVPAGWRPVPGGPADVPQQAAAPSPDMWQGRQGEDFAASPRGRGMGVLTRNDIPDPATLDFRQMMDFESQWLSAGRRPEELGPAWEQARNLRRQQLDLEREMATRQAQQLQQQQQAQFLIDNGTNPRIAPPAPPVDRSIGEGQYLPAEMIRLGQLGANMNNAPQANTMLPQLGLLSGPRRQQRSLGQLASPGV